MASLQAFIENIMPKKSSMKKPAVPLDYMPDWSDELYRDQEQMSVEQIKSALMGIANVQNKRVGKLKDSSKKAKK